MISDNKPQNWMGLDPLLLIVTDFQLSLLKLLNKYQRHPI
ncbi:hypothetical protein N474_17160 [Pseudoalteromonas luteoviolacea CPMOR-2]|nr:hypothetical protein N474_17160 [Pseudoalteromonas luteoviolacea CPMOR-2]